MQHARARRSGRHLLAFVNAKLDEGIGAQTIADALALVRRVYDVLVREERLARNPATRVGVIMRQAGRRIAREARVIDAWTRDEVAATCGVRS